MGSTTTFKRGRVVVVDVPFSDFTETKRRPALILSAEVLHSKLPDVIVCPISSQPRYFDRPGPGDQPLRHWKRIGLRHPSTARTSKILSVEKKLVARNLGTLPGEDLQQVEETLRNTLGL
jgi:mRNA interferase MazF